MDQNHHFNATVADPNETADELESEVRSDGEFEIQGGNFADGCAMSVVAALFAIPAIWMHWMLRKFADGDEWFDVIVRLILDEITRLLEILQ